MSSERGFLKRLLVDVSPLRESRDFRRLWIGTTVSGVGSQMTTFAVALQVFLLTHSSAAVGGTALVAAVPAISFGLFGGAIIDSVDRRKLVLLTSSLLAAVSSAFAVQAFTGFDHLWLLYTLVGVQATLSSVNLPARRTFVPRLLRAESIPAAMALTMLAGYTATFTGPVVAGLVTAAGGLKICYVVDAVSFFAALYGVARLPAMKPAGGSSRPRLRTLLSGVSFLRHERVLGSALLSDLSATVLAMPISIFPAINAERFHGSPKTLGLLTAAVAVGGIVGSGLSGPVGRVAHKGAGMLAAGALWGLAIAGFGEFGSLWATLLCLAVAGAADVSSVVMRTTIIQTNTPDELRGRVNAAEFVVGASGPQVGNFRGGLVATASTPGISAISGGLSAAVAAAILAFAFPALRRYRYESGAPGGADGSATGVLAGSAGLGAVEALVGEQEVLVESPEATPGFDQRDLEHPEAG
jgi:MFS family permease